MVVPTQSRRQAAAAAGAGDIATPSPAQQWLSRADSWGSSSEAVSDEALGPVLAYLAEAPDASILEGEAIVTAAKVFKALADQSRSPEIRHRLTETELASASSALLVHTEAWIREQAGGEDRAERIFLLVQLLRCICNLSADNDRGRAMILEHGGVAAIARVLATVEEVYRQPFPMGQAAFGAALNVALDNADCTTALLGSGALGSHIQALSPETPDDPLLAIWPVISMSLDNLCERGAAVPQLEANPDHARNMLVALARIVHWISVVGSLEEEEDTQMALRGARRTLLWTLCEALEKSSVVRKQLCTPNDMLLLFAILEHFLDNNSGNIESEANDSDGEKQADDEQAGEPDVAAAPQPPNRPMPQSANRQADAVTQMIVGISGEDDALEVMYANSDLMQRLLGILEAEDGGTPQRDALAAAAALCLGNLARTDAHCVQLVGEHPSLVRRLIHGWFARREAGVHVRHAVSGLLKNLCLPAANKQHLADMGLPVVAAANIDTAVVPIQANAIGILRHLATGAPAAATVAQMMQPLATTAAGGECAMQALLRIVKGTDIDGIRCEGTRLVAGVAKKIYLRRGASAAAESALLDKAQQTMEDKALDIVTPLIRLVLLDGQRHPLLQQESLVTLTVLAASQTVALKTTAYGGAPSYAHAIIAMLDPARSAPLAIPPAAAEDGSEESNESDRRGFGDALHALLRQEDAVWPQSTLQAKSLVNQLLATADDCADTAGLEVLHTKLAPLAT